MYNVNKKILFFLFGLFVMQSTFVTANTKKDLEIKRKIFKEILALLPSLEVLSLIKPMTDDEILDDEFFMVIRSSLDGGLHALTLGAQLGAKIIQAALEDEDKRGLLSCLLFESGVSYTAFFNFVNSLNNNTVTSKDLVISYIARLVRACIITYFLYEIQKLKVYEQERVKHRLLRVIAKILPSVTIGLVEAYVFKSKNSNSDVLTQFGFCGLLDILQNIVTETLGEIVLQEIDDVLVAKQETVTENKIVEAAV